MTINNIWFPIFMPNTFQSLGYTIDNVVTWFPTSSIFSCTIKIIHDSSNSMISVGLVSYGKYKDNQRTGWIIFDFLNKNQFNIKLFMETKLNNYKSKIIMDLEEIIVILYFHLLSYDIVLILSPLREAYCQ